MKIEKININKIKPAEYNPRYMTDETLNTLKENIQHFGLVDPIIINLKNNQIIGGHQRYKIMKQLNKTELNMIRLGDIAWIFDENTLNTLNPNDEKTLNISLNKINGIWDNTKLDAILNELNNIDLKLAGFEDIEIPNISLELNNYESNNTPKEVETETYNESSENTIDEYSDNTTQYDNNIDEDFMNEYLNNTNQYAPPIENNKTQTQNQTLTDDTIPKTPTTYTISIIFNSEKEAQTFLKIKQIKHELLENTLNHTINMID